MEIRLSSSQQLKYGQIVFIESIESSNKQITGEGFSKFMLGLEVFHTFIKDTNKSSDSLGINKALFQIVPPLENRIKNEVESLSLGSIVEFDNMKLERIHLRAKQELRTNIDTVNGFNGDLVENGASVQFLHYHSRKFLNYSLNYQSQTEENYSLSLSHLPSRETIFSLNSWYSE